MDRHSARKHTFSLLITTAATGHIAHDKITKCRHLKNV